MAHATAGLVSKLLDNTITKEELQELLQFAEAHPDDVPLTETLQAHWRAFNEVTDDRPLYWQERFDEMMAALLEVEPVMPVKAMRTKWWWAAAAVLLFCIAGGAYFFLQQNTSKVPVVTAQQDVAPGSNKAVLTLGNGKQIILDSTATGVLSKEGETTVINLHNQLAYQAGSAATNVITYNTITIPRGGQYQLILPDGSKVWLNAASSLRFPTAFNGKERNVTLTGEGYFEVAKNEGMPFTVSVSDTKVAVLGTHFNIHAYTDEPKIQATLLEGSIRFSAGANAVVLKPGEQGQANQEKKIEVVKNVDTDEVMAWKEGRFYFTNASVQDILQQAARWYDVKIEYKVIPKIQFSIGMSKDVPLSKLLSYIEAAGGPHCVIEGKIVVVQ